MLTEICADVRNYFCRNENKHFGTFEISGGNLTPSDFLQNGQYFRIIGSVFNDGVYKFPAPELQDETFHGAVWAMNVPPAFIALCGEIERYCKENPESALASESFAGYSYTKKDKSDWKNVFASKLNRWRKIQ